MLRALDRAGGQEVSVPQSDEISRGGHPSPRAIIADDDPFARKIIRDALQRAGITVVAEAQNGREAVELVLHYHPDVVLMDVVMPGLDGIAATRRIVKELPDQLIVMLSSGPDDDVGLVALRAGAAGFLTKDVEAEVLPRTLIAALSGEAAISRRMTARLIEHLRHAPQGPIGMRPVRSSLTQREWEVVDLMAESLTTEQMAERLVLSTETVRTHVKHILRKLDARSRSEAVAAATRLRGGYG
jgi:DNA-binding NarL/FixJ family response regulator